MGSWKIMLILPPRMFRISSTGVSRRSWPSSRICPDTLACLRSTSPITDRNVTLFPEPDSPTTPRVCPRSMVKFTPSTAFTSPSSVGKWTRRSLTSRSGGPATLGVPDPGIEERVHHVHHQVGHDDEEGRQDGHSHDHREVL